MRQLNKITDILDMVNQLDVTVRPNTTQAGGLLGDQARALGGQRGGRGDAMGGAALGALRGLRGLGASNLPKKTEKTVAAAKELNGFLQGFVEQVCGRLLIMRER